MNLANAAPIVIVILFVILIDETHRSRSRSRCLTSAAFTSVILLLAGALGPATGDAEKRLVGYWPFEEREGLRVEDASGAGRHGEILNDSRGVQRVAGRNGGALQFAGGDPNARGAAGCLALPGLKEQDWSKGLTVELWARFTALDRPATYEMVSDTRDDRGPGFRFMVSWLSLWLRSGEGGGGKTWGAGTDANVTPLRPGEWYHLAGTYDGADIQSRHRVRRAGHGLEIVYGAADDRGRTFPMRPLGRDLFLVEPAAPGIAHRHSFAFRRDESGRVTGATATLERLKKVQLQRMG